MINKIVLVVFSLCISNVALAGWSFSDTKTVEYLFPLADGGFEFALSDYDASDSCNGGAFQLVKGKALLTDEGYKTAASSLLAAFMARKEITVVVDMSTKSCFVHRFKIYN